VYDILTKLYICCNLYLSICLHFPLLETVNSLGDIYYAYKVHGEPLSGSDAIKVGSNIIIWDHVRDVIVFAGRLTKILGTDAIGENYIHDDNKDGYSPKKIRLSFAKIGLIPVNGMKDVLNPRFRTYEMPIEAAPTEHQRFKVFYKTPEQKKEIEAKKKEAEAKIKPDRVGISTEQP
jgi:hypothetical protein